MTAKIIIKLRFRRIVYKTTEAIPRITLLDRRQSRYVGEIRILLRPLHE